MVNVNLGVRDSRTSLNGLIDESFRQALISRIVKEQAIDRFLSERIVNQTLAFLKLVAENPGQCYAPSPAVDIGWHAFLLHTRQYADFCDAIAGRFIHHEPTESRVDESRSVALPELEVSRTIAALNSANLPVDTSLWQSPAKCGGSSCTNGDCTSGGPPGSAKLELGGPQPINTVEERA
jgi:hypothetical protein